MQSPRQVALTGVFVARTPLCLPQLGRQDFRGSPQRADGEADQNAASEATTERSKAPRGGCPQSEPMLIGVGE